jgi:hypothetical protein
MEGANGEKVIEGLVRVVKHLLNSDKVRHNLLSSYYVHGSG